MYFLNVGVQKVKLAHYEVGKPVGPVLLPCCINIFCGIWTGRGTYGQSEFHCVFCPVGSKVKQYSTAVHGE